MEDLNDFSFYKVCEFISEKDLLQLCRVNPFINNYRQINLFIKEYLKIRKLR